MSLEEYEKESIETHRKEMQQSEATTIAALATDYDFLLNEINRTRQRIKDESHQLESNVQLDLSFEKKRRVELIGEIESKGNVASKFLETKADEVDSNLKILAKQAMTAIFSLGAAMLAGFVGYKLYYKD